MTVPTTLAWRAEELGYALQALGNAAGLHAHPVAEHSAPIAPRTSDSSWLNARMERCAHLQGFALDAVECRYSELTDALLRSGPALVRVPTPAGDRFYAVVGGRRGRLQLVGPALARADVPVEALRSMLTERLERVCLERMDTWLAQARIAARRDQRARNALLELALAETSIANIWQLRTDVGASFAGQLREHSVIGDGLWAAALSLMHVALSMFGWMRLGAAALSGVFEPAWLLAWGLCVLSTIPLQMAASWFSGRMFNRLAVLLKQRLLSGALRLGLFEIRSQGSGRLLSIVSEAEVVESAGFAGLFNLVLALIQWLSAFVIFSAFASAHLLTLGLIAISALSGWLFLRALRARAYWTECRFAQDSTFVDNVLGSRTRVVQQPEQSRHTRDERLVDTYLDAKRKSDSAQVLLNVLPGRAALIAGCAGLLPILMQKPDDPALAAIALGGVVQAGTALSALGPSANTLISALLAWRRISGLFHGAQNVADPGHPTLDTDSTSGGHARLPALETRALAFAHQGSERLILHDCSFTLMQGDRALLEGPSGGGKSTLAALLLGLYEPHSGQILLRGLGAELLGSAQWRRRIASAPQFHDNHVLAGTLAFNLLMGRNWPCSEGDRSQAQTLCHELGLGPLLARMPAGLDQIVGETGWQLSHGERSRVYLARALLQGAEVVVLDESFAALDPVNMRRCVEAAHRYAPTLLVIAHR